MISKSIYVDLDCLLDTRLGTLITIDKSIAFDISKTKDYYLRQTDTFTHKEKGTLDKTLFKKIQDTFTSTVYKNSTATRLDVFIADFIKSILDHQIEEQVSDVKLVINCNYSGLSNEEASRIAIAVQKRLADFAECKSVFISYDLMSPKFMKDNFVAAIIYNPHDWLSSQSENLKKDKLSEFSLYTPRLYHLREMTAEEKRNAEQQKVDVFASLRTVLAPYIKLEFLSIALFCADTPANLPSYYQEAS